MKVVRELGVVMAILYLAHVIQVAFSLPIPSTVLGMIILLIALLSGLVKIDMIENIAPFSMEYLTFLFIPGGVGLISSLDLIADTWLQILILIILTTVIVIAVTGLTVQLLDKKNNGDESAL